MVNSLILYALSTGAVTAYVLLVIILFNTDRAFFLHRSAISLTTLILVSSSYFGFSCLRINSVLRAPIYGFCRSYPLQISIFSWRFPTFYARHACLRPNLRGCDADGVYSTTSCQITLSSWHAISSSARVGLLPSHYVPDFLILYAVYAISFLAA